MPHTNLINYLPTILESNPENEVFLISRVNTVEGLTEDHIKKWGWNVNSKGWVNFPDTQTRIWKKEDRIKWYGKDLETLAWFSGGYYNLSETSDADTFLFKDLRYPLMDEKDPNSTIFKFTITKKENRWEAAPFYAPEVNRGSLDAFWTRLKGI